MRPLAMLNELTPAYLQAGVSRLEKALDQRGSKNVTTIKPTGSPPLEDRTKPAGRHEERSQRPSKEPQEAFEFRREESSLHILYRSTRETVETSRMEKIMELRRAVKNGTYRPNLIVVAERLLSSGELGRF